MDLSSKPKHTLTTTNYSPLTGELTTFTAGEMGVCYKECLKNHAANLGGHALDGCGEFMPSPTATSTDPSSLRCAACGCHRNFHRRDPSDHLNFLPLPPPTSSPSGTESPPSPSLHHVASPVPCSYYSAPHHVHLSLSSGFPGPSDHQDPRSENSSKGGGAMARKRTRTKFTAEQKMKMRGFAERAGWKINGCDEKSVRDFCNEIGIERGVLKVWMHNNKYSLLNGNKIREISSSVEEHRLPLCLNTTHSFNNGDNNVDGSSSSCEKIEEAN